ncbi:MAG: glycosyltransferase [Akkermansia sp.]|nr:glycosyltransferase [Akkermansia sp.]
MLHILTERRARVQHPFWYESTLGMENAFAAQPGAELQPLHPWIARLNYLIALKSCRMLPDVSLRVVPGELYLFVAMSICDLAHARATLRRVAAKGGRVCLYCFDTWEPDYRHWEGVFSHIPLHAVFFAYRQSYDYFSRLFDFCHFLPQSWDDSVFHDQGVPKTRLFLQMGRRVESIHGMILRYMEERGIPDSPQNYTYRRSPDEVTFPTIQSTARAVAESRFMVCAPRSVDDPGFTGNVQDVTARFYEAMASKTLIIGYKPRPVFDELFPEDAMVELNPDGSDFAGKIDYFLNHPDEYNRMVERNYELVMREHTWAARFRQFCAALPQGT